MTPPRWKCNLADLASRQPGPYLELQNLPDVLPGTALGALLYHETRALLVTCTEGGGTNEDTSSTHALIVAELGKNGMAPPKKRDVMAYKIEKVGAKDCML